MPRIRILTAVAGMDFSWVAGEEIDLPSAEAAKWADGERAEYVRGERVEAPEGVAGAVETTVARPRRGRPPGSKNRPRD